MKLPIKKKWFDQIKSGKKTTEFREAHITFVCEETGERLTVPVKSMFMTEKRLLPTSVQSIMKEKYIMAFELGVPSSNYRKIQSDKETIEEHDRHCKICQAMGYGKRND